MKLIHLPFVIQTTEGRKNLDDINVDVHEILRFALNDKVCGEQRIHYEKTNHHHSALHPDVDAGAKH